jgi:hypothetical protein
MRLARIAVVVSECPALGQDSPSRALFQTRMEDLPNVKVTSVSNKEQKLSKTGTAIFVGVTNIPVLLRMMPRLKVAQIDANTWARAWTRPWMAWM